jgi:hypothetical protein
MGLFSHTSIINDLKLSREDSRKQEPTNTLFTLFTSGTFVSQKKSLSPWNMCNNNTVRTSSVQIRQRPMSPHEDTDSESEDPPVLSRVLEDLAKLTNEFGPNDVKVADAWNSLGLIRQHMMRNMPAAIKCHQRALDIYRCNNEEVSKMTMQIAVTLIDLGSCYERTAQSEQALRKYEEAECLLETSDISPSHRIFCSVERAVARLKRKWRDLQQYCYSMTRTNNSLELFVRGAIYYPCLLQNAFVYHTKRSIKRCL